MLRKLLDEWVERLHFHLHGYLLFFVSIEHSVKLDLSTSVMFTLAMKKLAADAVDLVEGHVERHCAETSLFRKFLSLHDCQVVVFDDYNATGDEKEAFV